MSSLQWAYIMVSGCVYPYTKFGHVCWYMYEYDNDWTVNELVSSHSDHNYDNDGTIDELVSSHSDHDYDNEGSFDDFVGSH